MKRYPLNFGWKRKYVDDQLPLAFDGGGGKNVNLPDDFIITLPRKADAVGGPMNGFFASAQCKYTRELDIPAAWADKKILLNIDGAYMNTEITLDGLRLDMHPYGYTPYVADLTEELNYGAVNVLGITTQSRQPNTRWYAGGGLYRDVSLLVGEPCYIDPRDLFVTTVWANQEKAAVQVSCGIHNTTGIEQCGKLKITLIDCENVIWSMVQEVLLRKDGTTQVLQDIILDFPKLWDCEQPNLYELLVEVSAPGQEPDSETIKLGIRQIEITPEHGMTINGTPIKLRGGCIHHDNGFLGAKAFPRAEERKVQLLKKAGYNAIRTAHNPPSAALLDACDKHGMLVMNELFDCWRSGKSSMDYHLYFEDWWERDTTATVLRDRNHPSVFIWSCGNEIAESNGSSHGEYWLKQLVDTIHMLDPTRPVTCGGMFLPKAGEEKFVPPYLDEPLDDDNPPPGPGYDLGDRELPDEELDRRRMSLGHLVDVISLNYRYQEYEDDCKDFPDKTFIGTEIMGFESWENWEAVQKSPQILGDFIWTAIDNLGEAGAGRIEWSEKALSATLMGKFPWMSCFQGDLDLTGLRLPRSYYRNIMWGLDKGIHIFTTAPKHAGHPFYGMGWHWGDVKRTWTFPEKYLDMDAEVEAYADCDEVAFLLNGCEIGRVKPERMIARCMVPYRPGTIKAIAYRSGEAVAEDSIRTAGPAARIQLCADRNVIAADGMDLSYITATIVDEEGTPVITNDYELSAHISGDAEIAGMGSGNPCTDEPFGTDRRYVFNGSAMICVRAGQMPDHLTLTVVARGLPAAACTIETR